MRELSAAPGDGVPAERPAELLAAALILYVVAGMPLLAGCLVGVLLAALGSAQFTVPAWLPVILLAGLGFAGLTALCGYQVQRGREWARLAVTALCAPVAGLSLAVAMVGVLTATLVGVVSGVGAIVGLILVVLLNTRPARAYCRDPRRPRGVAWPYYSER